MTEDLNFYRDTIVITGILTYISKNFGWLVIILFAISIGLKVIDMIIDDKRREKYDKTDCSDNQLSNT